MCLIRKKSLGRGQDPEPEKQTVQTIRRLRWKVLYCIVFIHFSSASHSMSLSEALPTTAIDTVSEYHAKALQATVSVGLAQGPYVAARVGFGLRLYQCATKPHN